MMECAWN